MPERHLNLSSDEMVQRGGAILKRYRHPGDWEEGSGTGKSHLYGSKALMVEELRLVGAISGVVASDAEAHVNAHAIMAFARHMGVPGKIQIDQQRDRAPYIYVSDDQWHEVLAILRKL